MKPGIYKNLSIEKYHENKLIVSSTGLKKAKKSTRDFAWYVLKDQEQKSAFDFGNAFELAIMDAVNGTSLFEESCAVRPTERWLELALTEKPDLKVPKNSATYQKLKGEFEKKHEGKYLIDDIGEVESKEAMIAMIDSCLTNEVVTKLLTGTEYQVSCVWKDPETGLLCKSRPDVCKSKKNVVLDIKTCKDASPTGFAKDACNLDYPLQAVMQIEGCVQTGMMEDVDNYFWLAVEKTPPYNFGLYEFQKEDVVFCQDMYSYYLNRCAKSLEQIKAMSPGDISTISSYGENAENSFGILNFEIPPWYGKIQ